MEIKKKNIVTLKVSKEAVKDNESFMDFVNDILPTLTTWVNEGKEVVFVPESQWEEESDDQA